MISYHHSTLLFFFFRKLYYSLHFIALGALLIPEKSTSKQIQEPSHKHQKSSKEAIISFQRFSNEGQQTSTGTFPSFLQSGSETSTSTETTETCNGKLKIT